MPSIGLWVLDFSRVRLLPVPVGDNANSLMDVVRSGARLVRLNNLGLLFIAWEPTQRKYLKLKEQTYEI